MKHTARHECEHMSEKEGGGACRRCLIPFSPRLPRFVMKKLPWSLEFKGHLLKDYSTLNKVLVETAVEKWEDFMILAPNGARYSIEFARMI